MILFGQNLHAHGTRFGRTAQGYGFDDVLACVHDVGGTSSVAGTMTHDRDQRSKIKSVSIDQKAVVHYISLIAIDFVLLVVT